jgi:ribulose-5-phosphate 4-epimerase/fuculose-1-phosphate aldolase
VDRVFGAVAVRIDANHVLVSPREKGAMFSSEDAVVVTGLDLERKVIFTLKGKKATLNAPLLFRVLLAFDAKAVVHLHEENSEWPTLPYAPPGTVRDNDRSFATKEQVYRKFNIKGHGCVFVEH